MPLRSMSINKDTPYLERVKLMYELTEAVLKKKSTEELIKMILGQMTLTEVVEFVHHECNVRYKGDCTEFTIE